jgi:hypothetical protein
LLRRELATAGAVGMLADMLRRSFLFSAVALSTVGCKSKAQKQADAAVPDVARLEKIIAERHVDAHARALPIAASALATKLGEKTIAPTEGPAISAAFSEVRDRTDDLRSAKRSYYAVVDVNGEIVAVDDANWLVIGRKAAVAFPALNDVLTGKTKYAAGAGRYGGADPEALTFFEASPILRADKPIGALIAAWEVHEAAEDLQRQLQTELAMKTVKPKVRAKAKDKYQLVLDTPDLWVAIFDDKYVWLQDGAPQPLEEGAKSIGLHSKTANGAWTGTFDVLNRGWGAAAARIASLGATVGVAVLRHMP